MKRRNFTLIELVVSLGILLLIVTTSALAVSAAYRSWRSVTEQEERIKSYRAIDRLADTALRNAVPFHWKDRNNKELVLFTGTPESVTLTYLHRIDDRSEGGIRFLRLFREGTKLVAEYRSRPFTGNDGAELPFEREVLADDVKALSFVYADRQDDRLEWFDSWEVDGMKNLPLAIQMEVEFNDGSRQIWLRRTAGNGQFQTWGRRLNRTR